jgi:hypothetical protein
MRTGYSFDDLDWQAIESAPPQTTADLSDGSYDYPSVASRVSLFAWL